MKLTILSFLFFLLVTDFSKADQKNSTDALGVVSRFNENLFNNFKVIKGSIANFNDFPYAVNVYADLGDTDSICTGFLIAEGVLLTAAHCLVSQSGQIPPSSIFISIGSASNFLTNKDIYEASSVIPHPEFSSDTIANDIGIVTFNITAANTITFAKIYGFNVSDDLPVEAAGWGVTVNEDSSPSNVLMSVPLHISSSSLCSNLYPLWTSNNDTIICTETFNGQGPCYGDSGGPLAYSNVSPMPVVGIISFGLSEPFNSSSDDNSYCGVAGGAGYYTHAFSYIDWIVEITKLDKEFLLYNGSSFVSSNSTSDDVTNSSSAYGSSSVPSSASNIVLPGISHIIPFYNPFISVSILAISIFYLI
ncbi:Serine protease 55 [Smittium mucronatum]|uniref:Serine protease 55 n=1 Tax=Smittium mucronatum TaxID=133383 RepID=A0A1R0H4L2_9FUNG|nr:Serine protease 55 [Smittium mucronatum]